MAVSPDFPRIERVGFDGIVVRFDGQLTEPANRAALAFCAAVKQATPASVAEVSTSLVSTFVRFDPLHTSHEALEAELIGLLTHQDWTRADLPKGRIWHVPAVFGGDHGPQMAAAAQAAGLSESAAVAEICAKPVRVQTIGFAPGMPYLGQLAPHWDIPRLTTLNKSVPAGGLCVAIRQLVLFPVATQTGWRQIAQTHFPLFQPARAQPFLLNPGDLVQFVPVDETALTASADAPDGGAWAEGPA